MANLRICLLGPPEISCGEEHITHHLSQKALGLLAYLVMGTSHGHTREELAGLFWGETDEDHANFNLRRTLWLLRKAINPAGAPSDAYVRYAEGRYFFNRSSDYWLDVNVFERAVDLFSQDHTASVLRPSTSSLRFATPDLKILRDAIQLYRGHFLQGCRVRNCGAFTDWLQLQRDQLEKQYVRGLRTLAVESARQGDYQQAITFCQQILDIDPLNEATLCHLMIAYYMLGKRDSALDWYDSFSQALRQQLGLEPLSETRALYLDIRNGSLAIEGQTYWLISGRKPAAKEIAAGPFVGRQLEQVKLSQALESAIQGGGCLTVVSGEAGIGKTRLIEEFLRHVSSFPLTILTARCYLQEQGLPYQPIIDALRAYLPLADYHYIQVLSNLWLAEVAKLLPELHNYLPRGTSSPALFPDQERNRLFEGFAQFIAHLSRRQPVILFLDDFHAADEPTFELIHYLARRLASARFLIVCALRWEVLADRPSLTSLLQELDRSGRLVAIPVARLSETEVVELIRRTLGTPAELEELEHDLYRKTGGNPFFLGEMLKAYQEWQRGATDELLVPSSVYDVIQRRLSRLDGASRRVLTMAAVIGRQFNSTFLRQIYAGDEQDLLHVLDRLLARGWIAEVAGAGSGTYDFSHGLVGEVVYQTLRPDWRRHLHRRVGLALESTSDDRDELAGVLAHHFLLAGCDSKAFRYSLQAAARARRLYANREAINHYQRALEIAARSQGVLSDTEWLEIHCQLGQAYEFLGEYDAAIAVYNRALPTIDLSRPDHRRICFQLAIAYDRKGEYDQALRHLRAAGSHLSEPEDSASKLEAAMVARGMAMVYLHREQSHQALAFCNQVLALIGSDSSKEKEEEIALENQRAAERVDVYEIMANSYFHLGNYEAAVNQYERALEIAQAKDWRPAIARLLLGLAAVARRQGNYAQAEAYAQQSHDLCHGIGHAAGVATAVGVLGNVAYHRGDFEQAIARYKQALSTFRQLGDQHGIADYCLSLAFVKLDQEEIDEADAYLQEALTIGQGINATLVLIRAQYHLAKVARARGRLDEAQARAEETVAAAQRAGMQVMEAIGRRLLGEILAQQRQPAQAEVHMTESLHLFESLSDRFEIAWTLRSYARLLADRGDLPHAQAQLQRAATIFAELGARRELIRTNADLARLQGEGK